MAHLTGNFTSEAPLSPAVREAISAAFEQGWADPKKRSQAAGRAAILADQAKSEIAAHLGTEPSVLEVIGEPALAHFIAIAGYLRPESHLITSSVDVGKIRAVARAFSGISEILSVGPDGKIFPTEVSKSSRTLISLQATNGETGVTQELEQWRGLPSRVIVDATRAFPSTSLVKGFAATTFDSLAWNGPAGLGFISISDRENFNYPLPHIAPIRVPGSFSLPLLIGSAVAIDEFVGQEESLTRLRTYLAAQISRISGVEVIASSAYQSRYLSINVVGLASEQILTELLKKNLSIDAGSACSPEDLAPSHVIAAMGFSTTGHLRFTLHPQHSEAEIDLLVAGLEEVILRLNS